MNKVIERFVLIDSFLEISNDTLIIKDKKNRIKNDLIRKGGVITIIVSVLIYNIFKKTMNDFSEKTINYVSLFLQSIGILFLIALFIYLIFRHKWKNSIKINELIKIEIDSDDEFEYDLTLITYDKRSKLISFRKLENQLEPFLETLKKRNTRIEIKYE